MASQKYKPSGGSLGIIISICALAISGMSLWNARQARILSEQSSLPELSEMTEMVHPLAAGQPINIRITITNFGHTTAKQMHPQLNYSFANARVPFEPNFSPGSEVTSSDLAPGDHAMLVSKNMANLAHDHDVAAVLSGEFTIHIYGRIPYEDVMGRGHEFHFCRLLTTPVAGADPLKLQKCNTFNYSY